MKEIIMTIGMPYSGKSTLARQYAEQGWKIIERDVLLERVINSDAYKQAVDSASKAQEDLSPEQLFEIKNKLAIEALNSYFVEEVEKSEFDRIFYDGTNLQRESRQGALSLKDKGWRIDGIVLDVPIEEIIRRAQEASEERRGKFNENAKAALGRMYRMFEVPTLEEGFSTLKEFRTENRESSPRISEKL